MRVATLEDLPKIQAILEHPAVRDAAEFVPGQPIHAEEIFEMGCFTLLDEHGCFVCVPLSATQLEVHTQFLPEARGREALLAARESLKMVFCSTDVTEMFTRVRHGNKAAKMFTGLNGFLRYAEDARYTYYHLPMTQWISQAKDLEAIGDKFHVELGEDFKSHEEEPIRNRCVGFAMECIRNGLCFKGIDTYNVMAALMGRVPLKILALDPLTIDAEGYILVQEGDNYSIQERPCQSQ